MKLFLRCPGYNFAITKHLLKFFTTYLFQNSSPIDKKDKKEKLSSEIRSYDTLRSSYGSRARESFDGILKHLKTSSKTDRDLSSSATQNDATKGPEQMNRKLEENSKCVNYSNSKNNENKCVEIIGDDKLMRSEKMNELKDDNINLRKIRKKLLPRSATSAADSSYSLSKPKANEDKQSNTSITNSKQSQINGSNHFSMKLRRKSEIDNKNYATNWMVRPTDPSQEASETDIVLLKRWIEQTQSWSMEENPLKSFRIKEGNDLDEFDIEGKVLRCVGGKLGAAPPVLITTQLDPHRNLYDDIKQYVGDRDEEGMPHGNNVMITFKNGDIFRGNIEHGERKGYGILQFAEKKSLAKYEIIFTRKIYFDL